MASSSSAFAAPAPATSQPKVRLWNSGTCPYAQRAWLALLEKNADFEHKIVDLQNKPEDFVALYASLHPDPTARAKVPILEHCTDPSSSSPSSLPSSSSLYNVQLIESSVCAEYIAEAFPGGSALLPSLPRDKAVMRLLGEMWTASGLGNYFPLLLAGQAGKEGEAAREQELEKLKKGMQLMDGFLRQYGCDVKESPFLLKSGFCPGEVCLAPFVQRLLIVVPHWVEGVGLLEVAEEGGWGRLRAWMEAVAGRESTVRSGGTREETIRNYTRLLAMMKGGGVGGGGGGGTGATTTK